MIVCVCHNISEGKIHQAVDAGVTSMPELRSTLGIGTNCGKCHSCAKHVLRACLADTQPTNNDAQAMTFYRVA